MITKVSIENFKGINDRQTIELKPITLLFGPNSAGKSTVIQAFQYALEILERHNFDPDITLTGGGAVELGGFRSLVHNHNPNLSIVIEFELNMRDLKWPSYDSDLFPPTATFDMVEVIIEDGEMAWFDDAFEHRDDYRVFRSNLIDHIQKNAKTVSIGLEVEWDDDQAKPILSKYKTYVDGQLIAVITTNKADSETKPRFEALVVFDHPIFPSIGKPIDLKDGSTFQPNHYFLMLANVAKEWLGWQDGQGITVGFPLVSIEDALPEWNSRLVVDSSVFEKSGASFEMKDLFLELLTLIIVGPGEMLLNELKMMRCLGPIRRIPQRDYMTPRFSDSTRWSDGMAAWDTLTTTDPKIITLVSKWLAGKNKLNTGYTIGLGYQFDFPIEGENPLDFLEEMDSAHTYALEIAEDEKLFFKSLPIRKKVILKDSNGVVVLPPDVGVGISQLLPVLVGALTQKSSIFAVEQPELHIHPAVQVALGDLFISQIKNRNCIFLLETHSEHLILRLMRRIRETYKAKKTRSRKPRNALNPNDLSIIYFSKEKRGIRAEQLPLDEQGRFLKKWPHGFFEERHEELFP